MSNIELPPLPEPDTRSLALSGRCVDYITGYEHGYESAAEDMRDYARAYALACVEAERERVEALRTAGELPPAPHTRVVYRVKDDATDQWVADFADKAEAESFAGSSCVAGTSNEQPKEQR